MGRPAAERRAAVPARSPQPRRLLLLLGLAAWLTEGALGHSYRTHWEAEASGCGEIEEEEGIEELENRTNRTIAFTRPRLVQAVRGFELGMISDDDESGDNGPQNILGPARPTRVGCEVELRKVEEPLAWFMETVGKACRGDPFRCVPALTHATRNLSNITMSFHTGIGQACPPQVKILFTAVEDPFFVMNMGTLAVLRLPSFTLELKSMFDALAKRDFCHFGICLGHALRIILPLVRLPLRPEQLNLIVHGFVHQFLSKEELVDQASNHSNENNASVGFIDVSMVQVGDGFNHKDDHAKCLNDVQAELDPSNQALGQIAGSVLNMTCYRHLLRFSPTAEECMVRCTNGLSQFAFRLHMMYGMLSRVQKAHCPKRFIEAMRRLDQPSGQLALDMISNFMEDLGTLQLDLVAAADDFYSGRLENFGMHLGRLFDTVTERSFDKYKEISVPFAFADHQPLKRLVIMVLLAPCIFLASMLLPFCLFCSATSGWPPLSQDVKVSPTDTQTSFDMSYSFFGGGHALGSKVEFRVESADSDPRRPQEKPKAPGNEAAWDLEEESLLSWSPSGDSDPADIGMVLKLTDGRPPASCVKNVLRCLLGFVFPCLGRGPRRWKLLTMTREDGDWVEDLDLDGDSAPTDNNMVKDGQGAQCSICLNYQPVRPPVQDLAQEIQFNVRGARSAVLHVRPKETRRECADWLLLLSAGIQLFSGTARMIVLFLFGLPDILFHGEMLTFWFDWSRFVGAALLVHKKLHARWYFHVLRREDNKLTQFKGWCWMPSVARTPTPVFLLSTAPALRTATQPLFQPAYRRVHEFENGDEVRIVSRQHQSYGMQGTLLENTPDVHGQLLVRLGGAEERVAVHDLDMIDSWDEKLLERTPIWDDRLTRWLITATVVMWIVTILHTMIFGDTVTDDYGHLNLRLDTDKLSGYFSGQFLSFTTLVQLTCLLMECAARVTDGCMRRFMHTLCNIRSR